MLSSKKRDIRKRRQGECENVKHIYIFTKNTKYDESSHQVIWELILSAAAEGLHDPTAPSEQENLQVNEEDVNNVDNVDNQFRELIFHLIINVP